MITIRRPEDIFKAQGSIEGGTFEGRWHFSFGKYYDPQNDGFGTLLVFNDDTLSPGAVWPLHPHSDIEVVTYCAGGEFRHADEKGPGGVLKKGHVQHTTVGKGMWHSEINNRDDSPMRFVQMWFKPSKRGLIPSVEQKGVERNDRRNSLLKLVSGDHDGALPIHSDAGVYSSFLEKGRIIRHSIGEGRGVYLYVLEGGPVEVNGTAVPLLGAAKIRGEKEARIEAKNDSEILLVDVAL